MGRLVEPSPGARKFSSKQKAMIDTKLKQAETYLYGKGAKQVNLTPLEGEDLLWSWATGFHSIRNAQSAAEELKSALYDVLLIRWDNATRGPVIKFRPTQMQFG